MNPRGAPSSNPLRGTLRARLSGGAAVLLGVIAIAISWYVPLRIEREALDLTAQRATSVAEMTAYSVAAPLVFEDDFAIQEVFAGALRNHDLHYLVLTDLGGRVVASYDHDAALAAGFLDGASENPAVADEVFKVEAAVTTPGGTVGTLYLGLSLTELRGRIRDARRDMALVSLLLFALGAGGVAVLSTIVTGPVRRIVTTMEAVSAGDLGQRTDLKSRDELGFLGRSFDDMVGRLEEAYEALRAANRDLEERVRERTRDLQREVDERTRAEAALRESERRFRAMFESSAVGIAIASPDGDLLDCNPSLRRMLDLSEGEPLPASLELLAHPDDRGHLREVHLQVRDRDEARTREIRFAGPDGTVVWTRALASVVLGVEGEPDFGMFMLENITDQKALEEQLRQSQKLEAVGQLAGGVAHDFNNLLTTINGLAEMAAAEHADDPALVADLREIRKAGDRAATLTAQLLAFSRRQILRPEEVDLVEILRDTTSMLERLIGPSIRLELDFAPDTHGIQADPGQISQVIMNLVVNARDAMVGGGHLRISTSNVGLDADQADRVGARSAGDFVRLQVSDDGKGMDEATLGRIFEPFFTTKEQGKGTGLGLSMVYGIVRQSDGGIEVRSRPGVGTTFRLYFPSIGPAKSGDEGREEESPPRGAGTILVVEDEPAVRSVISRVLRRTGYTVLEAHHGRHALEVLQAHGGRVDGLVTDVVMPHMTGPELVRVLSKGQPTLPVLYLSGFTQGEALEGDPSPDPSSTASGRRHAFMQKPMQPLALAKKVEELLTESRATSGVAGLA